MRNAGGGLPAAGGLQAEDNKVADAAPKLEAEHSGAKVSRAGRKQSGIPANKVQIISSGTSKKTNVAMRKTIGDLPAEGGLHEEASRVNVAASSLGCLQLSGAVGSRAPCQKSSRPARLAVAGNVFHLSIFLFFW